MEKERRETSKKMAGLAVRETEPNIIFGTVLGGGWGPKFKFGTYKSAKWVPNYIFGTYKSYNQSTEYKSRYPLSIQHLN